MSLQRDNNQLHQRHLSDTEIIASCAEAKISVMTNIKQQEQLEFIRNKIALYLVISV
jgi:hypothetical protein